jgi:hypothetical protein
MEETCIIYNYLENNENKTHLSFFLKYGIDQWESYMNNITYLFLIRGGQCEVMIPNQTNIYVVNYVYETTEETWKHGLYHLENLFGCDWFRRFDFLFFMDANVMGPLCEISPKHHWLEPFYNSLRKEKGTPCSCSIMGLESHILCVVVNRNDRNWSNDFRSFPTVHIPEKFSCLFSYPPHSVSVFNFMEKKLGLKSIYSDDLPLQKAPILRDAKACVIYAHYDKDNMIQDYVVHAVNSFMVAGFNVLFYTSSEIIKNVDLSNLSFAIRYYKNKGVGTDWYMWLEGLLSLQTDHGYEWVMFVNDSLLLPLRGINHMQRTIEKMRKDVDFWGHWDSNEIQWHIVGTPFEFRSPLIPHVITFIRNQLETCKEDSHYAHYVEVKLSLFLKNLECRWKVVVPKESLVVNTLMVRPQDLKYTTCTPSHNAFTVHDMIAQEDTFAVKFKYCMSYLDPFSDCITPEFRFLARYLCFGPRGHISNGEKMGVYISSKDFQQYYLQNNLFCKQ